MARLLAKEDVSTAGQLLRDGGLVSFPTETVYGLGANALSRDACLKIFVAKKRPLTDPLIVHIPSLADALPLVDFGTPGSERHDEAKGIFEHLAATFWPGPLTIVAKAAAAIPSEITAGTGFVGLRHPRHPLAQRMLEEAKVPVAAPSANLHGHVSPTTAQHVMDDLFESDVAVLDGGSCVDESVEGSVGIESTVAKVDADARRIVIFRRGGISQQALEAAVRTGGFSGFEVELQTAVVKSSLDNEGGSGGVGTTGGDGGEEKGEGGKAGAGAGAEEPAVGMEAPGQLLTHYAPNVTTYLLDVAAVAEGAGGAAEGGAAASAAGASSLVGVEQSVVLDFGAVAKGLEGRALAYRDLSPDGTVPAATKALFEALRWAESVEGAQQVLLVDLERLVSKEGGEGGEGGKGGGVAAMGGEGGEGGKGGEGGDGGVLRSMLDSDEHAPALYDRMFRSASGKKAGVEVVSAKLRRL
jgi:tRNA threonylcarbamoyl adenosine modification protein (Sua5/YciO/YrdC/YwlC family)